MVQALIAAILEILGDSSVTGSGLIRTWSGSTLQAQARTVTVTDEPAQDQPVPYVRVTITDSGLIPGEEPHGYGFQPDTRIMRVVVNVFSNWETEARAIAAAIEALLVHHQLDTDDLRGWTYMEEAARFYTDNTADPNQVYRIAALTFRATVQEKGS